MSVRRGVQSNDDEHRVTTFELFFDLVFVFAVTQLTAYMDDAHTAAGIVQAMLLLRCSGGRGARMRGSATKPTPASALSERGWWWR
jgi:hypothetical protein